MDREQLFELWAPSACPWSRWAKPILFADRSVVFVPGPDNEPLPPIGVQRDERTAVIVDLPGAEAVRTGLALAADGYRPVPLFNGARGPSLNLGATALVNVDPIVEWLSRGADLLSRLALPALAPPAFLLDANRQMLGASPSPGRFDNRWLVFPQDFPSANFLRSQNLQRVLLLQNRPGQPATDLAHVLLRWQQAGLELYCFDPTTGGSVSALTVSKPSWFGLVFQRALALAGLRRNSAGGFGSVIPQPSSGVG
jgi:hypothetical protein